MKNYGGIDEEILAITSPYQIIMPLLRDTSTIWGHHTANNRHPDPGKHTSSSRRTMKVRSSFIYTSAEENKRTKEATDRLHLNDREDDEEHDQREDK